MEVIHVLESKANSIPNREQLYNQIVKIMKLLKYLLLLLVLNFLCHPGWLLLFSTGIFLACIALDLGD